MYQVTQVDQVTSSATEEIIQISAELRFDKGTGVLTVYMSPYCQGVKFLPEESEALKEQFEELVAIFPQLTEHGFQGVSLSRLGGKSYRKPFFDFGVKWVNGLNSLTRGQTDGYWKFDHYHIWKASKNVWGHSEILEENWMYEKIQTHIKTWTMPHDRPRGFIPTSENRGVWTAAQVRQIRFWGTHTEQKFYHDRGI